VTPIAVSDGSVFAAALAWLQDTLLGSVATSIAIVAFVVIGLQLMSGRIHQRRAIEVVLGCFIIFGASSIASGLITALHGEGEQPPPTSPLSPTQPVAALPPAPVYDPYAGAAVPPR
jgi:type IV secretion system protein VirB2